MTRKQKKMLVKIIIGSAGLAILMTLTKVVTIDGKALSDFYWGLPLLVPYLGIYIVLAGDILRKAFRGIVNGQLFDENFLMAVATLGAFALGIYQNAKGTGGDYDEALAVILFYQVGEFFQSMAVGKSRRNIASLMDIRPDYANIEKNGKLERVSPESVETGTIITVQPGEKIPIDGTVVNGMSTLNTSVLTGESAPRDVSENSEVISGCINLSGVLKIRTTRPFGESTVSKILDLVENATSKKSKSENFISKFARIYTPVVVFGALAMAILPPLIQIFFKTEFVAGTGFAIWETWIYRALTFLVISCPCALVISIPLSFFAGIGGAGHEGILIKGSNYLETLSKVKTVVFDKTGTLTEGNFKVSGVHHSKLEEQLLIEKAALAESASSHPISKSLLEAYGKAIDRSRVSEIREISGKGLTARIDGKTVAIGNGKLMEMFGIKYSECSQAGTVVHIAEEGNYLGHILICDRTKENSARAIRELKRSGITETVMLTGDADKIAQAVGKELNIDRICSQLLPAQKVAEVENLLAQNRKGKLAFAGDGINDAPVLTRADIGIAMGALGSDAAIEAADIVLMDDDPLKIAKAILISKKCMSIVYQNIFLALGIKAVCLVLGAVGIANMWIAIFADVGVMILAVLNSIRNLFTKKI